MSSSTESTTPVSGPPSAPQPAVEFIRTRRQTAAYVMLGLSLAFLIATIWLGARGFKSPKGDKAAEPKAAETKTGEPLPELPKVEIANPKKSSYLLGGIAALAGFLVTASAGVYLQIAPHRPSLEMQLREARVVLLSIGGLLGAALILFGAGFFYLWSDSLTAWLDKGEKKEMVWVVIPLLMVAGGAGLVFTSLQPARAEERNNLTLRRLVYGSNFAVTVLLLFVALIIVNVVVAMKVPNKLDTTESGFYSLADTTKAFLSKLPEPVKLYLLMVDDHDRLTNDIRQFAFGAQDASEGKLKVQFVSPVSNKRELASLKDKYPRIGRDSQGVLITVGEDEKRNAFVPLEDLFEVQRGQLKAFAGEGKVMRELRFLADNEQKAVVYFTQGNGELSIAPSAGIGSVGGAATRLKSFLEKAYLDVRPLVFPLKDPKVPEDAAVVIVAEPQTPLSAEAVNALRQYMNPTSPTGKKGKLIVLAGATPGPNGKGMNKTGLETLLAEFNVRMGDRFIYNIPTKLSSDYRTSLAMFTEATTSNPITQTVGSLVRAIPFRLPREVSPVRGGNSAYKADALLVTAPGRYTWLESDLVAIDNNLIRDLVENPAVATRKQLTDSPRSVAVVVSESAPNPHGGPSAGGTGRLLVIGNSVIFSDRVAEGARSAPITFDMLGVAIDWLRDRPTLATTVENKVYREYLPPLPAAVDTTRLVLLPLGLALLLVIGFGAGVWVIRRK